MRKLRTIFMGTPDFAVPCLTQLHNDGHEVILVVTQPDRPQKRGQQMGFSPVKTKAIELGLSIFQPSNIKEPEAVNRLQELAPDVIVVVAFGQLLPKAILQIPLLGCINVHASLLPYYRGAAPIHRVVLNGEKETGITTMYMDVGMDDGDMLLQEKISISEEATTGEIHDQLMLLGANVLSRSLQLLANNQAPRHPQEHSKATYAAKLTRDMEKIVWTQNTFALFNLIRGLNPWPGAYSLRNGKTVKIWKAESFNGICPDEFSPGQVVFFTERGFVLRTGDGLLELQEVQPESKRRMSATDYASGYRMSIGERWE